MILLPGVEKFQLPSYLVAKLLQYCLVYNCRFDQFSHVLSQIIYYCPAYLLKFIFHFFFELCHLGFLINLCIFVVLSLAFPLIFMIGAFRLNFHGFYFIIGNHNNSLNSFFLVSFWFEFVCLQAVGP